MPILFARLGIPTLLDENVLPVLAAPFDHMASPSSPVLRTLDWVKVVLTTPPAKLTPSAYVSRIRRPVNIAPFVPFCSHTPTLVCSIHRFEIVVPEPYVPPMASCGSLSIRYVFSPKMAKSRIVTLVLPLPKKPSPRPVSLVYQMPAPRIDLLLGTLMCPVTL